MEKEFELLKNPFDGLSNYERIKVKCAEIARKLFCNYRIKCNNTTFSFAEIEFYYYDRNAYLKDNKQFKWQEVTYPRDDYKAGQLFYHLSGIDICFDSQYKKEKVKFGGILIRAIKDESGLIIAGPLNCKDEILNTCKNGNMPELICTSEKRKIVLVPTYRSLGKTGTDKENDSLCFFDGSIGIGDWNPERDRFVTKTGTIEKKKGSYDTSKFIVNK
ncbi:MAG: hypothetical protein IKZ61_01665 [Prevotella sp.]|nr:hypothetical protein [Prevotella sp.]